MKLTKAQMELLHRLAHRAQSWAPESGPEMAKALGHVRYWATPKLKAMKAAGLVKETGCTLTGAGCFSITDAGRTTLRDAGGGDV